VAIGPIAFTIVPRVDIKAYANWEVQGEVSAGVSHTQGRTASLSYVDGVMASSTNQTVDSTETSGPAGSGSGSFTAGIDFGVQFLIDDVAGPGLTGGPYLKLQTNACALDLLAGAHLDLTLNLNTFVDGIQSVSVPLASGEKVLASTGYHCTWSGTVHATFAIDEPHGEPAPYGHETQSLDLTIGKKGKAVINNSGVDWEVYQPATWSASHHYLAVAGCGDDSNWTWSEDGSGGGGWTVDSGNVAVGYKDGTFVLRFANATVPVATHGVNCDGGVSDGGGDRIVMPSPVDPEVDGPSTQSSLSGTYDCSDGSYTCTWDYDLVRHLPDGSVG
jgi:hypothetical protein